MLIYWEKIKYRQANYILLNVLSWLGSVDIWNFVSIIFMWYNRKIKMLYDLRDDQWEKIKDSLPGEAEDRWRREEGNRGFLLTYNVGG